MKSQKQSKSGVTLFVILIFTLTNSFTQNLKNIPEGIQENLPTILSPTVNEINTAFLSIPDSINGDINKDKIKAQRWMHYVFPKYNILDSNSYSLSEYSSAMKNIYSSSLNCSSSDPASWTSEGPTGIPYQNAGWVSSVYGDPDDTMRILIGTNTSGIFKTTNGGIEWNCITDDMNYPVLGVNQIVPSPNDEDYLLATTGTNFIDGGLIYSNNRGEDWNSFSTETPFLKWIDFHPTSNGCLFGVSRDSIFYSKDFGQNWSNIGLPSGLQSKPINNFKVIVTSNRIMVISLTRGTRITELFEANISIDANANLNLSWNNTRRNEDFKTSGEQIYFFDFSNKISSKFFLQVQKKDTLLNGATLNHLFVSYNNGNSFMNLPQSNIDNLVNDPAEKGRPDKNELIASENDTNIVYWGSLHHVRRSNIYSGSDTIFNSGSGHHDDYRSSHYLNLGGKDRILFGNDGGTALVKDGLSTSTEISSLNGDISNNLIHAFHLHEPTGRMLYAFQDHKMRYTDDGLSYSSGFIAEGSAAMIQDKYPLGIVAEDAYGSLKDYFPSPNKIVEDDFADDRCALGGYFQKYRHEPARFVRGINSKGPLSSSGGVAMNRGKMDSDESEIQWSSSIGAVSICQRNSDYIYAAESNIRDNHGDSRFKFYRSTDDGYTWDTLTQSTVTLNGNQYNLSNLLIWKSIRAIAVDHTEPNVVYCGISGTYTENGATVDETFRVIKSTNYGDSLYDFSDGLPALPVERLLTVESDENLIFCATSVGIYYRMDGMTQWECFSENLPMVEITGMQYDYCTNELWVSTYGRGMWKTPVPFDVTSSYQTEISGIETWNDFKILKEDLVIKDGGVLTITDTVQIAYDKKIVVEPGGRLNIDGGVLTNYCNKFWKGIEVMGDYQEPQMPPHQGILLIKNNSVIENARIAVNVWKHGSWSTTGGMIYAYNSTFKNNWKSMEFMPYQELHNGVEKKNKAVISNCEFIWNDDYKNLGGLDINPAITLYDVNGVRIIGCDFNDQRTYLNSFKDRSIGIKSLDASYRVSGRRLDISNVNDPSETHHKYDTTDFDISTFTNLFKGVEAMNANSQSNVTIDHCKFYNNRVGSWITGVDNAMVTRNYFLYDNNHPTDIYKMNDLIIDQSTGFDIEGNILESTLPAETIDGVIINNSGLENNRVFKNEYSGVYAANMASGVNTNDLENEAQVKGLQWLCNDYGDFKYDQLYSSASSINPGDNHGVRLKQGLPGTPAGNTFSADFDSNESEFHFKTIDPDETVYYANLNSNPEIPTEIAGEIEVIEVSFENECLSNFGNTIIGVSVSNFLSETVKSSLEVDLGEAITSYESKTNDLQVILDEANTAELYERVGSLDSGTWEDLHDDLLAASPYLKRDLLETLGNQTNPNFPHNLYVELILANPEIVQSASFMSFLLNKPDPLPTRDYQEVDAKRYDSISERGERINEIISFNEERKQLSNLLLKNELSDTIEADWMIFKDLLDDRNDIMKLQQMTDFYYGIKNISQGDTYLDSLVDFRNGLNPSYVKENLYSYIKVKEYVKDSLFNSDGIVEGLDSTRIVELTQLRDQYAGFLGGDQASNILCFHAGICKSISTYPTYSVDKSAHSTTSDDKIIKEKKVNNFRIIPNPNNGTFKLQNLTSDEISDIKVYSPEGRIVEFVQGQDGNKTHLSLKNGEKGIYYIQIITENNKRFVEKFVIN